MTAIEIVCTLGSEQQEPSMPPLEAEPDCPELNALGSLVCYAHNTNRVESAVSSGLPFEPERDRTYGQRRAPESNCCGDWNEL